MVLLDVLVQVIMSSVFAESTSSADSVGKPGVTRAAAEFPFQWDFKDHVLHVGLI